MTAIEEEELRSEVDAELGGFVLWTDNTPHSNEPTELEYFIKGLPDGDKIWERLTGEVAQLIQSREAALTQRHEREMAEARIKELKLAKANHSVTLEAWIETRLEQLQQQSNGGEV